MNELIASAENGDPKSQYHLGVLYQDGKGVEKDYVQAAYWYRKAAEQGHVKAQMYLGLLYSRGFGVPRNYDSAIEWLTMAAESGNEKAEMFLERVIAERDSEGTETHSPSKMLIISTVIALSLIITLSAHYFIGETEHMLSEQVSSVPVNTLLSVEDFYPPINDALTESKSDEEITYSSEISINVSTEEHIEDPERNLEAGKQQVEKLLKAKRVSPFVRDTGTFEFNPDYEDGTVDIIGSNVRMRKQPNTKSRIVKTASKISPNESLKYLGEWTSPQGDKWVVCAYKENQKVRDVDAKIVWISKEYVRLNQ